MPNMKLPSCLKIYKWLIEKKTKTRFYPKSYDWCNPVNNKEFKNVKTTIHTLGEVSLHLHEHIANDEHNEARFKLC